METPQCSVASPYHVFLEGHMFQNNMLTETTLREFAIRLVLVIPPYEYPQYEVYSFCLFCNYVCLSVCLSVCKLFSVNNFSATTWVRILKYGTKLDSDELYYVTKEQPHIAY